jgi:hypothetical protein
MLLAATAISSASTIVYLNAATQGAVYSGSLLPGTTITSVDNPVANVTQFVLGPGTYIITNADPNGTDYSYAAWNYSYSGTGTANNGNWLWAFAAVNDATKTVLLDDYVGTGTGTALQQFLSPSAASGATGIKMYDGTTLLSATTTASFSDTLTLASTTTVDFFIPDYIISDDLGGIALNVTREDPSVPEPASFLLVGTALAAACLRLRRRAS